MDDVEELQTDSRDYIWAYLYQAGVFSISEDLKNKFEAGGVPESSDIGRLLRAAVIVAGWEISRIRQGEFSARDLGCYVVDVAYGRRELIEGSTLSSAGTSAF